MNPTTPKVSLIWHTPEPQKVIALAARMCYSALPVSKLAESLDQAEIDRMVKHILQVRHYSVLRHVLFMFTIEGVSRSFSHQFVRHHVGVDVEQRSQHYRREKDFDYNLPEAIKALPDISETKDQPTPADMYHHHMSVSQQFYDWLISRGAEKSDARQVLPNACETQMVTTMNLEAVMNVLKARSCRLNTPEILQVAVQIRRLVGEKIPEALPFMGPTCWTMGVCFEGEKKYMKSCQRPWQSPTVLWDENFPKKLVYVALRNGKHSRSEFYPDPSGLKKEEPEQRFQEAQGEDGKNQS